MSTTFTKLFASITESTVWCEPSDVRIVWITMLAMADRHGRVWGTIPGLASRARVSLETTLEALRIFQEPDPYSRTKKNEGRRIKEIDGGWVLLNHGKYRTVRDDEERRAYKAQKERERRKRLRGQTSGQNGLQKVTNDNGHAWTSVEDRAGTWTGVDTRGQDGNINIENIDTNSKKIKKVLRGQTSGQNGQTWTGVERNGHNADTDTDLKTNTKTTRRSVERGPERSYARLRWEQQHEDLVALNGKIMAENHGLRTIVRKRKHEHSPRFQPVCNAPKPEDQLTPEEKREINAVRMRLNMPPLYPEVQDDHTQAGRK